jgi:SAM-dependent MidA family methyltransferase
MKTFRDFMENSLYDPQEGFYSRRTPKEDFYTAPELHPAFAKTLAGELCARLQDVAEKCPSAPLHIVEMGSGEGRLARQIITTLKEDYPAWAGRIRYVLVERVEELLLKSVMELQGLGVKLMGYSKLEELRPMYGVFFSNELVDAMPVHVLEKHQGRMKEVYVESRRKHGRPKESLGLLSSRALVHEGRKMRPHLIDGQRHAVNLEARTWMRRVASLLRCGSIITIDYGKQFTAATPNLPRAYFKHTIQSDLTAHPGRQDLTASADFSDLISVGENSGLATRSFATMARFLLDRGILHRLPEGGDLKALEERMRIKTLFHPDGMGEKFKVLIQEKGLSK